VSASEIHVAVFLVWFCMRRVSIFTPKIKHDSRKRRNGLGVYSHTFSEPFFSMSLFAVNIPELEMISPCI